MVNKDEKLKELGNRIKELREGKNLSQAKFGVKILKDQQSIHKVESGQFNPTFIYLLEVSEGLEISLSELLKDL